LQPSLSIFGTPLPFVSASLQQAHKRRVVHLLSASEKALSVILPLMMGDGKCKPVADKVIALWISNGIFDAAAIERALAGMRRVY
jgi:hypothetical protein